MPLNIRLIFIWSSSEDQIPSIPNITVSTASGKGEEQKLGASGTKRKAPGPPKGVKLINRFLALKIEEEPEVLSSKASGPFNPKPCKSTRREQ